jgi:hypothetical protein
MALSDTYQDLFGESLPGTQNIPAPSGGTGELDHLIESISAERGLDSSFVRAHIKKESGFDPSATSYVGAAGLMQIMPKTGEQIAHELGEEYSEEKLYDPETNLRWGTYYFKKQLDTFGNNEQALAAYHAGPGNVQKAMAQGFQIPQTSDGLSTTEDYVNDVIAMWKNFGGSTVAKQGGGSGAADLAEELGIVAYTPPSKENVPHADLFVDDGGDVDTKGSSSVSDIRDQLMLVGEDVSKRLAVFDNEEWQKNPEAAELRKKTLLDNLSEEERNAYNLYYLEKDMGLGGARNIMEVGTTLAAGMGVGGLVAKAPLIGPAMQYVGQIKNPFVRKAAGMGIQAMIRSATSGATSMGSQADELLTGKKTFTNALLGSGRSALAGAVSVLPEGALPMTGAASALQPFAQAVTDVAFAYIADSASGVEFGEEEKIDILGLGVPKQYLIDGLMAAGFGAMDVDLRSKKTRFHDHVKMRVSEAKAQNATRLGQKVDVTVGPDQVEENIVKDYPQKKKRPEKNADLAPGSLEFAMETMGVRNPETFAKLSEGDQARLFEPLDEMAQNGSGEEQVKANDAILALDRWLTSHEEKFEKFPESGGKYITDKELGANGGREAAERGLDLSETVGERPDLEGQGDSGPGSSNLENRKKLTEWYSEEDVEYINSYLDEVESARDFTPDPGEQYLLEMPDAQVRQLIGSNSDISNLPTEVQTTVRSLRQERAMDDLRVQQSQEAEQRGADYSRSEALYGLVRPLQRSLDPESFSKAGDRNKTMENARWLRRDGGTSIDRARIDFLANNDTQLRELGVNPDEIQTESDFVEFLNSVPTRNELKSQKRELDFVQSDNYFERHKPNLPEFQEPEPARARVPGEDGEELDLFTSKVVGMEKEINPLTMGGIAAGQDLPDKAGNINLKNVKANYNPKRHILEVSADYGRSIDRARRGKIKNQAVRELAENLGMSTRKLLKRKQGEAFNAEQALAARDLLNSSANRIVSLRRDLVDKINKGTASDLDRAEFRTELQLHAAIQAEVAGMTAEAGRALNSFRIMSENKGNIETARKLFKDTLGINDGDFDKLIMTPIDDPKRFLETMTRILKGKRSAIHEYWINGLLSSPVTHIRNAASNTLVMVSEGAFERPAAATADLVATGFARMRGKERQRQRFFREVKAEAVGVVGGLKDAAVAFGKAWGTGLPTAGGIKVEGDSLEAIKVDPDSAFAKNHPFAATVVNKAGKVIRTPTRLLTAADEFFKTLAYRSELQVQAYRQARIEKSKDVPKRVAEILSEPPKEMVVKAQKEMEYRTFTQPLGKIGGILMRLRNSHPSGKWIVPFMKTPANILKYTFERAPVTAQMSLYSKIRKGEIDGAELSDEIAKGAIGAMVSGLAVAMAKGGMITGGGPKERSKREELYRTGWLPYAIKINDKYFSFASLEPIGSLLGLAADFSEIDINDADRDTALEIATKIGLAYGKSMFSKSFLKGPSEFLNVLMDPDAKGERFLKQFGRSFIPNVVAGSTRITDRTIREAETMREALMSRIPVLSESLNPKRNIWGQPVQRSVDGWQGLLSPMWISSERQDAIDLEMARIGVGASSPGKTVTVSGEKYSMPPEMYDEYAKAAGERARERVESYFYSSSYRRDDDDRRRDKIKREIDRARSLVRSQFKTKIGRNSK